MGTGNGSGRKKRRNRRNEIRNAAKETGRPRTVAVPRHLPVCPRELVTRPRRVA